MKFGSIINVNTAVLAKFQDDRSRAHGENFPRK